MKKFILASTVLSLILASMGSPAQAASGSNELPLAVVGDSYASGSGGVETGTYLAPTPQCERSRTSVGKLLDLTPRYKLVANAACSGATTQNITTVGQHGELPQVAQVPSTVKRGTVTVGGNDVQFGTLAGCIVQTNCMLTPVPGGVTALVSMLQPKIDAAFAALKAKAPGAVWTVVLYPRLLPQTAADLSQCPFVDAGELAFGNQVQTVVNTLLSQRAAAYGFRVADPSAAFAGHDICAGWQSWFYLPGMGTPEGTFHPNPLGRAATALVAGTTMR